MYIYPTYDKKIVESITLVTTPLEIHKICNGIPT